MQDIKAEFIFVTLQMYIWLDKIHVRGWVRNLCYKKKVHV